MATLKYKSSTGKLLMKDGHLCTTCCYPYVLGRIWISSWLCGNGDARKKAGNAIEFSGQGMARPGTYWRIWDWAAGANGQCTISWGCFCILGNDNAKGLVDSLGRLVAIYDARNGPPFVRPHVLSGVNLPSRNVDIQISDNGTTWPAVP